MPCIPVPIPVRSLVDHMHAHCLLAVFDHLPICDVFSLDKICSRFRSLKPHALARRREFTLVVGNEWRGFVTEFSNDLNHDGTRWFGPNMDTWTSRLRYETLTKDVCDYLARSLPNVSRLQVMQTDVSSKSLEQVIYLVAKWAPKLITLKIGARFRESRKLSPEAAEDFISYNLAILLTFINQLPELEHLSLQLHHRLLPAPNSRTNLLAIKAVDLSALSHLKTAYLLTNDRAAVFFDSLKRYAERNQDLVSIGLQCCIESEHFYRSKLSRLNASFFAKIRALDLGRAKLTQADMDSLGAHLHELTSLGLALATPVSLLPILLRSCKRLTRLHLYASMANYLKSSSATNRSTSRSQIASVASRTSSSSAGPQLPQIVALTLSLAYEPNNGSHQDLASLRLEQTFPRLQMLEYNAPATCCTICGLRVNASPEQRKRCHCISLGLLQKAMPNCKVTFYLDL